MYIPSAFAIRRDMYRVYDPWIEESISVYKHF